MHRTHFTVLHNQFVYMTTPEIRTLTVARVEIKAPHNMHIHVRRRWKWGGRGGMCPPPPPFIVQTYSASSHKHLYAHAHHFITRFYANDVQVVLGTGHKDG